MLEPWIIIAMCAANAAFLGLAALLFFSYRRTRDAMNEIERHGISTAAGEVPSVVLERETSVEIVLPENKRLVVSVLPAADGERWRKLLFRFLSKQLFTANMLPFLEFHGMQDEAKKADAVEMFAKIQREHNMTRELTRLLDKTLLRRRPIMAKLPDGREKVTGWTNPNPDRITGRWLYQYASDIQIAEIVLIVYAYNSGAYIKKNYLSLLENLAKVFPGMNGMRSFRQSRTDTARIGGDQPLYPDCRYTPALTPNGPNTSDESLTKPRGNDDTEGDEDE